MTTFEKLLENYWFVKDINEEEYNAVKQDINDEMQNFIKNKLGYKLEPVTDDIFSKTVTTFLNDTNLKNKISGIATDLTKNKLLNYFSQNLINADITNSFLNKIGFSWPILDFEYFKKYFGYFKNINFF